MARSDFSVIPYPMSHKLIAMLVASVTACSTAPDLTVDLAIVDTTAYACTPVLVPGPTDEGVIGEFVPGPAGLMAWSNGDATLRVGTAMDDAIQVGRRGEGPGEFTFIDQIGWSGDTLWATDMMLARVQYFDRDGNFLRGHRLPVGSGWRRSAGGRFLSVGSRPAQAGGWGLLTMTGDSAAPVADTVFHFPGPDPVVIRRPVGDGVSLPMHDPFLPTARVGASSDALRFCGSEPLEGDDTRIRCVDHHGGLLLDTVITLAPLPLTDEVWDRVIRFYTRSDSTQRGAMEALFTRPAMLPRVTDIGVDRNGSLWLYRGWAGDSVQTWLRLTADGVSRDTMLLTRGYIAHVSGDTLWRSWTDEDGMQSVERCVARE